MTERPTVLIIGGFLSSPPLYARMRMRLLRRGAAEVVIANLWTPDWLLIPMRGHGPTATRSARGLLSASRKATNPVLVVGHSAGGILARILTATVPFEGRRFGGAGRIGAIVTLGSPHGVVRGRWRAGAAAAFANEQVPGAWFAPTVGYLTVASRLRIGRRDGSSGERSLWRTYARLLGAGAPAEIAGDGLIPVEAALLPGARQLILDDISHGQAARRPWYGSEEGVDQWWTTALEAWEAALGAREPAVS